jgi:hypothetical protein
MSAHGQVTVLRSDYLVHFNVRRLDMRIGGFDLVEGVL